MNLVSQSGINKIVNRLAEAIGILAFTLIITSCERNSDELVTSDLKMTVQVDFNSQAPESEINVFLEDYTNGPPGYLAIAPAVTLNNDDRLFVTVDGRVYPSKRIGRGHYRIVVPTLLDRKYTVQLNRLQSKQSSTGGFTVHTDLNLIHPINKQSFSINENITISWMQTGAAPDDDFHFRAVASNSIYESCYDTNNILIDIVEAQEIRSNRVAYYDRSANSSTHTAASLINVAARIDAFESYPSITRCNVVIETYVKHFESKSKIYDQISIDVDDSLYEQQMSINIKSNPAIIELRRD